jgi:hypothetical protein
MQEHFCLVEGVSEVFNNATQKVIKDAIKHTHLVSIVVYYMQLFKQQMKPT